jgi:hypothetical protein
VIFFGSPKIETCRKCGAANQWQLRWQKFKAKKKGVKQTGHIRRVCAVCLGFHRFEHQTPGAIAEADHNPPYVERPDQSSLFGDGDEDGGEE